MGFVSRLCALALLGAATLAQAGMVSQFTPQGETSRLAATIDTLFFL